MRLSAMDARLAAGLALACALTAGACDKTDSKPNAPATSSSTTAPKNPPAPSPAPKPDNTAVNERDRAAGAVTPPSQGENERDIRVTAEIRKLLVADGTLSTNAQNCKIITKDGVVTLRGPVATQAEKDLIAQRAKGITGVVSVANELEVTPPK